MDFIGTNGNGDHCQVFSKKEMTRLALLKLSLGAAQIIDRWEERTEGQWEAVEKAGGDREVGESGYLGEARNRNC